MQLANKGNAKLPKKWRYLQFAGVLKQILAILSLRQQSLCSSWPFVTTPTAGFKHISDNV